MRKVMVGAALVLLLIACLLTLLGLRGSGLGMARVEGHAYMVLYGQTEATPASYPARNAALNFERRDGSTIFEKKSFEVTTDSVGWYSLELPAGRYLVQSKSFWGGAYHL